MVGGKEGRRVRSEKMESMGEDKREGLGKVEQRDI
jgi:hypothetical protein